ncbi:MAG: imidazole glycerol phosphate synthase subunit HisF [Pseudobutyrivibrio sp.]|jgi:cyclase|uniref:Imidazole glycerol phosphate synthase subunit HisF n=2 Tax=Pseudobutyrivibrio TaxID=46205 RepID=A0A2G3DYR6_9FIRM|nr:MULTISPECIES: AglZ/HisF2 family acetamidino modification protein [Pseudobutyrivibrio]MBE5903750.1 imidazole glycerol phosphate synthase subunit HisF [Pseudobutyrivibrio sp.]NEX02247.1 imidazole glycerol phosphate synthase subunit HisF [Pseudobutyrivibrio xylanivorans]PHU36144.1 imidazole glycerol phosphate synthase subunit HisF [Pseudobutyrivibrio ruminis]SFR77354.1 cyclase [Pseudobutyrivibrio sp. NOR37]
MFNRPRIIPVLLIDDRDLIKTINFKKPTYLGDPVNALKIFNRKGIDEMAVLDISASKRGVEPDFELLTDMASEAFMPLSYGGGIKTLDQVRKLLAIGYEKVVLNTSLVEDEQLVKDAVALAGSQSVVASIDAKLVKGQYKCVICDGTKVIDMTPVELAKHAEELGVGEIFLNSIDRDGMMSGYDTKLINEVVEAVSIPVTACGGAGGISDLKDALQNGHAHAAAGGSMFVFYGRLKAVLITAPTEEELTEAGIYTE